ncbi:hypothetical protein II898_01865 [bacterium]|nr:hypothetical protein [bacterium]
MKKFFAITLLVFAAILVCSCSTHTVSTISVSKEEKLKPEGMRVWSRPIEMGFQVSGSIEGNADNKIYDSVTLEAAQGMKLNLFSKNEAVDIEKLSPLMKLAAFNAIQTAKADGMVITMAQETDNDGKKEAWVKGIALKLVIYDEVSAERSDAFRYCEISCEKGNCQGCIILKQGDNKTIQQ